MDVFIMADTIVFEMDFYTRGVGGTSIRGNTYVKRTALQGGYLVPVVTVFTPEMHDLLCLIAGPK